MLVSVRKAAHDNGVSRVALYRWIKSGIVRAEKFGRAVRVEVDDKGHLVRGPAHAGKLENAAEATEQTISGTGRGGEPEKQSATTKQTISAGTTGAKQAAVKQTILGGSKRESKTSRKAAGKSRQHIHQKAGGGTTGRRRR